MVAVVVNGSVNETPRNDRDDVEHGLMAQSAQLVLTCTLETEEKT
jgi:hypothetical protein